jgi:hypothetical protein
MANADIRILFIVVLLIATGISVDTRLLDSSHQKQHDDDDENHAEDAHSAMAVAIPVTAETPAKSADEKEDKQDDQNEPKHDATPVSNRAGRNVRCPMLL